MKEYLTSQGRPVAEETFYLATRWSDPERDVRVARELALDLVKRDRLFCVWTGKKLKEDSLDIDHCFPWPNLLGAAAQSIDEKATQNDFQTHRNCQSRIL